MARVPASSGRSTIPETYQWRACASRNGRIISPVKSDFFSWAFLRRAAVVTEAKHRGIPQRTVEDFLSVIGAGLQAKVDGKKVLLGRQTFLEDNGVTGLKELTDQANRLSGQARSLVWVACDGVALGLIGIADPIKVTTPGAIQQLHAMGIKVVMAGFNRRASCPYDPCSHGPSSCCYPLVWPREFCLNRAATLHCWPSWD
jgi:hypothetical protein